MTTCSLCHGARVRVLIVTGHDSVGRPILDHRACFVEWDRYSEGIGHIPEPLEDAPQIPSLPRKIVDRTGRRYGRCVAVREDWVRRGDGRLRLMWLLRCDCGRTFRVEPEKIHPDHACIHCTFVALRRGKAARFHGLTVGELAEKTGVSPQAVRKRIQRGWSLDRILARRRAA